MADTQDFREKRWQALVLLCSAQFVVVLDASIVNVALPTIGKALNFSQENLPWVVNAYILTFGGFLLLGGRTADLLGRRRVFMAGLLLVAAASLAAGFASTEGQLIAARAAQGLGAAIISPAALSIVTTTFSDGSERNKALGVWGAVAGSGGAAGVLLGGVLTDGLGWEWVLWVNVPVSLIAFSLSPRLIAESRAEHETRVFDVAGAVTVTAALSTLVYALVDASSAGWGSTQTIGLIALSVVLMISFVVIELRARKPLVPFSIFRIRTLTGANVVGLLVGASLFSMFFFISLYMQQVLGYSAIHAGLSYLPLALTIMASAAVASQLVTRFGYKPVLAAGLLFIVIGLVWFSRVSVGGSFTTDILGPSLFAAAGLGFAFVTTTIAAVSGVEENEAGLASGLINTSQQIGGALGLAVLSTVATSRTENVLSSGSSSLANGLTEGFQAAFLGGAAIAALGFVLTLVLIRSRDSKAHVELGKEAEGRSAEEEATEPASA
ncbi:MAG TPA: MFS transporter [Solirubrobacterales bacterium]|nr:MFS transporter [Solirubrobacterales bacterium]